MIARRWHLIWMGAILALGAGVARAENLDAGKSGPALFAATCQACHASPRGLVKDSSGLTSFLREHYTASADSANLLASYLIANGGRAATKQDGAARKKTGQTAEPKAKSEPAARQPPQTATARPDSMIEPVEPRRQRDERAKGSSGKRQPAKQETTAAPAQPGAEPAADKPSAAGAPPAASAPPAAAPPPAAAAPPPNQPAFSAPSP